MNDTVIPAGRKPEDEFLQAIFHSPIDGAKPLFISFKGDPKQAERTAWVARSTPLMDPRNNNYFSLSSFYPDENGKYRRRKAQFAGMHCVFVDDVYQPEKPTCGGKILRGKIKLQPSARIESSPNNFQVFYILDTPIRDPHFAAWFVDQLVHQGLEATEDPGMAGIARVAKVPWGVNGKASTTKFNNGITWENRLRGLDPTIHYSVEQLAEAYNIDLDQYSPPVRKDNQEVNEDRGLEKFLKFTGESNGIWQHIQCPWVAEHSDNRDDGSSYRAPYADEDQPKAGFVCNHGHCAERGMPEVRAWAREQGWNEALEMFANDGLELPAAPAVEFEPLDMMAEFAAVPCGTPNQDPAPMDKIFTAGQLVAQDIPSPLAIYGDWFRQVGIHLIYAAPGLGKTWVAMQLLNSLGTGDSWLDLPPAITTDAPMMYVDGELPLWLLQERINQSLAPGFDKEQLQIISAAHLDTIESKMELNLALEKMRQGLEASIMARGIKVLVLDNLLSLVHTEDSSNMDEMMQFNLWTKSLRAKGILVIVIHHSNKAGAQFGTRGNEVFVDSVINLARDPDGQASFKVQFDKCRLGPAPYQDKPFVLTASGGILRSLALEIVEDVELTMEEQALLCLCYYRDHQGEPGLTAAAMKALGIRTGDSKEINGWLVESGYIEPTKSGVPITITDSGIVRANTRDKTSNY